MGSDYASDHPEEYPAHRVTLPAFRIDVTPVTVAAYRASQRGRLQGAPESQGVGVVGA